MLSILRFSWSNSRIAADVKLRVFQYPSHVAADPVADLLGSARGIFCDKFLYVCFNASKDILDILMVHGFHTRQGFRLIRISLDFRQ
jgi:hypothetical protein